MNPATFNHTLEAWEELVNENPAPSVEELAVGAAMLDEWQRNILNQ